MNIPNNPVITNPVSPKPTKLNDKGFACGSGICQNSHTFNHKIDDAPRSLIIELPKLG